MRMSSPRTATGRIPVSSVTFYRTPADVWLPGLMSLMLLVGAMVLSHRQVFWIDETYAWNLIHDPSLVHANYALRHAADGGLPVYYNLAWVWDRLTGGSVLALRLFSAFAVIAAVWVLWGAFRSMYRLLPTAIALFAIFGGSNLLLKADAEVRFYGLFFFFACAVFATRYRRLPVGSWIELPPIELKFDYVVPPTALVPAGESRTFAPLRVTTTNAPEAVIAFNPFLVDYPAIGQQFTLRRPGDYMLRIAALSQEFDRVERDFLFHLGKRAEDSYVRPAGTTAPRRIP